MKKNDYFKYCLRNNTLVDINQHVALFTIIIPDSNNTYVSIENKKYIVKIDGVTEIIDDVTLGEPFFKPEDIINLSKGDLTNLNKDVKTTVGNAVINYVLLSSVFKDKIPYINGPMDIGKIGDSEIAKRLGNDITVNEFITFMDRRAFLELFSYFIVVSGTEKNMQPAPGRDEYKKEMIEKIKKEKGEDAFKDYTTVAELDNLMVEYDKEYLKDDPSYGKLTSGKITNIARKKMYGSFGAEVGFGDGTGDANFVGSSLEDGIPEDKEQIASMFNSSRAGSISRGQETQKGGAKAKDILRAINSAKLKQGDCGSKKGKEVLVTKKNIDSIIGRYQLVNSKPVLVTEEIAKKNIGKRLLLRSTQECNWNKDEIVFCSTCTGENLAKFETGLNISGLEISNAILTASLKSMHGKVLSTVELDMNELLS